MSSTSQILASRIATSLSDLNDALLAEEFDSELINRILVEATPVIIIYVYKGV